MLELADIVRAAGAVSPRLSGSHLLPAQQRALHDIVACRTPALGGHVRACDHCDTRQYSYHSCRNRHCPKCHGDQTRRWLDRQRARLLPCAYFLLTFTLPAELRALARAYMFRRGAAYVASDEMGPAPVMPTVEPVREGRRGAG